MGTPRRAGPPYGLPAQATTQGGQFWTPIGGQYSTPVDKPPQTGREQRRFFNGNREVSNVSEDSDHLLQDVWAYLTGGGGGRRGLQNHGKFWCKNVSNP